MELNDERWDTIITPQTKILDLRLREVIRYRDLVWLFIKRDFTTVYKQTILGPIWFILNPLFSTIIYSLVFGSLAKIGTDGIPYLLFYYGGSMLWTYFSACFTDASNVFSNNVNLFGKVYFPRLTVPLSRVFSNMITTLIQFATLMCFYVFYLVTGTDINPQWWALAFPLLFIWIAMFATGIGMLISSLTTKYRDLKQLVMFGLSLAMYATPIVYPLSQVPDKFRWVFYLNPLSAPIELFRLWFYGAGFVPPPMICLSIGLTLFFFLLGLIMFNRNERTFVDVI
ncbi:transport permease protein [Spirochaetia bacterium]|nr:transport permease protein [Spirochaetia bacterium]